MSNTSPQARLCLRLYVAGESPNSVAAKQNIHALLEELGRKADLEVVDVLTDPKRGLRDGILITPTLIRVAPAPEARAFGSLRDRTVLLAALGLEERPR
jgi:circadian clock protein KaiB